VTLSEQVLAKGVRRAVIADLVQVVDEEVADKKGISGTAVKAGYAAVRKVMPDLTERAVRKLLPDFAAALNPFWNGFQTSGGGDFGSYLSGRGAEVSDALLSVTDRRVKATSRQPIKKAYQALRGKADDHVQAALPRLGAALQKHAD
jgi:hypothetical protein